MKNYVSKTIAYVVALSLVSATGVGRVLADCEPTQYGEICTYDRRLSIDKDVRIEGTEEWKESKITDVKKDDVIEFRIRVENRSEEGARDYDNMETKDKLPKELVKVGGDGLTEEWDDFGRGEHKTIIIKAKIDPTEFDRSGNFEKCVVNRVELRHNGNFEGSDTATVCYGRGGPTELPKTGATSDLALIGIGSLTAGVLVKVVKKLSGKAAK